jgi:hypothetical protein
MRVFNVLLLVLLGSATGICYANWCWAGRMHKFISEMHEISKVRHIETDDWLDAYEGWLGMDLLRETIVPPPYQRRASWPGPHHRDPRRGEGLGVDDPTRYTRLCCGDLPEV